MSLSIYFSLDSLENEKVWDSPISEEKACSPLRKNDVINSSDRILPNSSLVEA